MVTILEKAKVSILMDSKAAFYANILCNTLVQFSEQVPTAATNGDTILINEPWFTTLSPEERVFLLMHEVLHIAFLHVLRVEGRDKKKWNHATDYAINSHLVDQGYTFIQGGLLDRKYDGKTAEVIYGELPAEDELPDNILDDDLQDAGSGMGDTQGDEDTSTSSGDPSSLTPEKIQEAESKIQDKVINAVQTAQMMNQAGSIPSDVLRAVEEILHPQLPAEVLFSRYLTEKTKEDYSWSRRNRRYTDVYLPSLYSDAMGTISVYVDASCSVTQKEFSQYIAEILNIKSVLNPKLIEVVSFDTRIQSIQEIHQDDIPHLDLQGGGGTNLREVAKRVNETEPEIVVLITDGYYTPVEYNKEVMHIIVNNSSYINDDQPVIHLSI